MALPGSIKNFRHGKVFFTDNTGVPISLEILYEPGDFSVEGMVEAGTEVTDYKDRGRFQWLSYTNQLYPTWSLTCWCTALIGAAGAGNIGIPDLALKVGGFALGVGTLGSAVEIPWTTDCLFILEGTDLGDGVDTQLAMDDNRVTLGFAEGDPTQFTLAGTCYGAYAVS